MLLQRTRFILQRLTNVVCSSNDEKKHMKKKFISCEQSTYQSCSFFSFIKVQYLIYTASCCQMSPFWSNEFETKTTQLVEYRKTNACVPQKQVKTLNHVYGPYAPCSKYTKRSEHDEHNLQAYGNESSKFLVNCYRQFRHFID